MRNRHKTQGCNISYYKCHRYSRHSTDGLDCWRAVSQQEIYVCLLPDTQYYGLRMRWECRERFPLHRELAIPTCITARAWCTCRDACQDHKLAVSSEVGGWENVPGIPGACATRNCTYLARGPWQTNIWLNDISILRANHNESAV